VFSITTKQSSVLWLVRFRRSTFFTLQHRFWPTALPFIKCLLGQIEINQVWSLKSLCITFRHLTQKEHSITDHQICIDSWLLSNNNTSVDCLNSFPFYFHLNFSLATAMRCCQNFLYDDRIYQLFLQHATDFTKS